MLPVYSAETIRAAERATGELLDDGTLMQRAAAGLASVVLRRLRESKGRRVLLAVGPGNNGGDGLWAGVRLLGRGIRMSAWRTAAAVHREGWDAFLAAGGREVGAVAAIAALPRTDLVVDAVLGIGGRPGLSPSVAEFARACADLDVPVVAVDLPSGLDADGARRSESFGAATTVTFGGRKPCHVLSPARAACGEIVVVDIGLSAGDPDLEQWTPADVARVWPMPGPTSDKYSRGVVGLDTGSAAYRGAAILSALGATHAGAGMVRFLGDAEVGADVVRAVPDVVVGDGRVQARVLGCGWGQRPDGGEVVDAALTRPEPLLVDADALRHLPSGRLRDGVLLTPHAGELARLLGVARPEVENDPLGAVAEAVVRTGATVLLKGSSQVAQSPGERPAVAVHGPAWTAQAGSGDTLAGICGTLLAAGLDPRTAALAGASVQAMTASRHPGPHPPQRLVLRLPATIARLAI